MTAHAAAPGDVDTVRTAAEAAAAARPPLLVLEPLEAYLDAQGVPPGELAWRRIGDGQANLTYELRRGGDRLVLRRGPRPPYPPSAHDMVREARFLTTVGAAGMPVPRVRAVCEDDAVLGVPFYLMDLVEGEVVTGNLPAGFTEAPARRALVEAAVDALADLHAVPLEGDVATLGRPAGYLERQVRRFAQLWPLNTRREVPLVERVGERLAATMPAQARSSIVHGDYRLGNLMYATPGRVAAILDWEMAALGDPLADLGYLVATYSEAGTPATPMDLTPVTALPGFPTRRELVERYAARTGADVSALPWYEALALWKSAIFCEAMHTRWLDGQRPGDDFAAGLGEGVPALAAAADAALARLEEGKA
ncbi:phosphotransferase family protein [Demequina sp. SYSU T00192]|uniref:Phosphotransferase family protein n=1 Tax=Demequina litoralis TaxID=3051660 RepID=A0ABT8G6V2_9MICO|nr:phosphotransferase family protein [Demequina sp. SYSU T00192]MDN4474654.1 phosphotransferase family protein [Demequina sp. SYSU T00192]